MQRNQNMRIAVLIALVVVGLFAFTITLQQHNNPATARILIAAPDLQNVTAKLDGKKIQLENLDSVITIKPGTHKLAITKTGFQAFSTEFTALVDQPVIVQAVFERTHNPEPIADLSLATKSSQVSGWTMTKVSYYGSGDWALAFADRVKSNSALFVLRYDDASEAWIIVNGPESSLSSTVVREYPADLQDYLRHHNHIVEATQ